ncbi:MAG TPA: cysteine peptidase family C39 domain-containing protein [Gemmataceae bacterium]
MADSPFVARADENLYFTSANCCGLVAAYMVANDLGHPVALGTLASRLPVSSAGTSMHSLEAFLQEYGFDPAAVEMDSGQLFAILERDPRLRAIALMRPHHWITLFSASQGKFDCYSYPERVDIERSQFDRLYAKRVLLVGPFPDSLNYLRNPGSSWANSFLLPSLTAFVVGFIITTWCIVRRRVRRSTRVPSPAVSP